MVGIAEDRSPLRIDRGRRCRLLRGGLRVLHGEQQPEARLGSVFPRDLIGERDDRSGLERRYHLACSRETVPCHTDRHVQRRVIPGDLDRGPHRRLEHVALSAIEDDGLLGAVGIHDGPAVRAHPLLLGSETRDRFRTTCLLGRPPDVDRHGVRGARAPAWAFPRVGGISSCSLAGTISIGKKKRARSSLPSFPYPVSPSFHETSTARSCRPSGPSTTPELPRRSMGKRSPRSKSA